MRRTGARSNGVLQLTPVADIEAPTAMAVRAGDSTLYVAEQNGRVLAVRDGVIDSKSVLNIEKRVETARREEGLLGLAFSPDGSKLYVHYTPVAILIRPRDRRPLDRRRRPERLGGDRLHVGGRRRRRELRMGPTRGQPAVRRGGAARRGPADLRVPESRRRLRGHRRVRLSGHRIPDLVGAYLFSDFCEGQLRVLRRENGEVAVEWLFDLSAASVAAFGQDNDGEIFVLSQGDGLLRLDPV
jgi:hypothetical protein